MDENVVVTWNSLDRLAEKALIRAYSRHNLPEAQGTLFKRIRELEVENTQMWRDNAKNWNRFRHRIWSLKPTIRDLEFEFSRLSGLYECFEMGDLGYVEAVLKDCQKYSTQGGPCLEHLQSLVKLANVSKTMDFGHSLF